MPARAITANTRKQGMRIVAVQFGQAGNDNQRRMLLQASALVLQHASQLVLDPVEVVVYEDFQPGRAAVLCHHLQPGQSAAVGHAHAEIGHVVVLRGPRIRQHRVPCDPNPAQASMPLPGPRVRAITPGMAKQLPYATSREIFTRFREAEPEPKGELEHLNAFTLLVAVALSAQATDVGVNRATRGLFQIADTPEKMLALGEDGLIEHIKTIGLYRNKAKNLQGMAQRLSGSEAVHHGGVLKRAVSYLFN